MARGHWLVKTEPGTYSWADMLAEGECYWDGVRNYQARNNLRAMKRGDHVLWYHSVKEKRVVGIVEVTREHYPDPTTDDERWSVVDLRPIYELKRPVTLAEIKAVPELAEIPLIRQSRLSVMPLDKDAFDRIVALGGGKRRVGRA
ncbi:MAG: EVE domain-containing protein [Planctomycetota bacterium]|nr:MAG: EVE domain-containing protein [Planctomycetota bacterium]